MQIQKIRSGSVLILKLSGRLDIITAPELEKVLKEELQGVKNLTFDLEQLEYISSAGLRVLLIAIKKMNAEGSIKVKNVNDLVGEVFEVTGFSDFVEIE